MSKLKITIEPKTEPVQTCKHEVGGVYKDGEDYYILAKNGDGSVCCVWLDGFDIGIRFDSKEHLDHMGSDDIPVDAELLTIDKGKFEKIMQAIDADDRPQFVTVKKDPQVTFAKDLSMWLPKMDGE